MPQDWWDARSIETHVKLAAAALDLPELIFAELSLWMERTRWAETYKRVDRDLLSSLIRLPLLNGHPNRSSYPLLYR